MNKVIDSGTAIIGGCLSGLAGCSSSTCKRDCLRKDPKLTAVRVDFGACVGVTPDTCRLFISLES
jgi:hypothetical protein